MLEPTMNNAERFPVRYARRSICNKVQEPGLAGQSEDAKTGTACRRDPEKGIFDSQCRSFVKGVNGHGWSGREQRRLARAEVEIGWLSTLVSSGQRCFFLGIKNKLLKSSIFVSLKRASRRGKIGFRNETGQVNRIAGDSSRRASWSGGQLSKN
jgi:hypothetical protein